MDFVLSPAVAALRMRVRDFVEREIVPLEANPASFEEHGNIRLDFLDEVRTKVKAAGLWAPQMPRERGGLGLDTVGMAALYEEMGRSIFGPVAFNCAAPDDGNMLLLNRVATEAQKERWLDPVIAGRVRSSFAMTEPAPGAGSDLSMMRTTAIRDGDRWVVHGHKWFITGGGLAQHFILVAKTADDERRGLTAFLFDADQPGWEVVRRIPIMGPEEHGGHVELHFDGLEIPDEHRLLEVGDWLRVTQIRLGTARLTHCMRWLGMAQRAMEIAAAYVEEWRSFGTALRDHEGVQWMLSEAAMAIEVGRLLTMRAAWRLDQGDFARQDVSMAKVQVADALHKAVDTAIQLCGARGYSKDTPLEWMYRYATSGAGTSEAGEMTVDLSSDETRERLEAYIAEAAGVASASITRHETLEGGAIQQNIALDVTLAGGEPLAVVLRTSGEGRLPESRSRAEEFAISRIAFEAGVTTPEPLWLCTDLDVIGQEFSIVRRIAGTAAAFRIVRDATLGGSRPALLDRLGRELATLHAVRPPRPELTFLATAAGDPALAEVAEYRGYLDSHATPRPAIEWALRWLELNAPDGEAVLCHGDFRTGNYMVDEEGLVGILDWEFGAWRDPMADIGWFTARCWRGARVDLQAGGIGEIDDLLRGYEAASGRLVERELVPYWELMAHVRWAIIAMHQAERDATESRIALELALTGRIVNELEFEVVRMVSAMEAAR